jgi:phospholipase C
LGFPEWVNARRVRRFYHGSDDIFAGPRPEPARPAGVHLIPQIQHVVLLMMENHSYDCYFATLDRGERPPMGADGQQLPERLRDGTVITAERRRSSQQRPHSPPQGWHACHLQYADGQNNGFAQSVADTIRKPKVTPADIAAPLWFWTEDELPFYYALARTFTLADRWHSSCLGPTFPNRRFLISGTAHGLIDDQPIGIVTTPPAGTIFQLMTRNRIRCLNYHSASAPALLARRVLTEHGLTAVRHLERLIGRLIPHLLLRAKGNLEFTAGLYPLGLSGALAHLRSIEDFHADAAAGRLPPVCVVDPDFDHNSEENPQDISKGVMFASQVINSVLRSPCWKNTVLIWCYDEHGGYRDHVPPPAARAPDDTIGKSLIDLPRPIRSIWRRLAPDAIATLEALDGDSERKYDRLGFRVPAVIVSSFSKPGSVVSDVFDHTSALRLIEDTWNLPSLTERDKHATSPIIALDFASTALADGPAIADALGLPPHP